MVLQGGSYPAKIKDSVTSKWIRLHAQALINANYYYFPQAPGVCTIGGPLALEDEKVRSTISWSIQIAMEHASKLVQLFQLSSLSACTPKYKKT